MVTNVGVVVWWWVVGVLAVFTILGMKRVNRLDKFEKML